ncbi:MAG TPA: hypothetical protein VEZ24_01415 [Microvirga sp.]|nr:hypothetical protein [Microvirga sp.]
MSISQLKEADRGFALVDALVALAVLGLTGSALVGLFVFVERSAQRTLEIAQVDQGITSVSRILRHITEEAYSVRASNAGVVLPHGTDRAFEIATTGPRILGLSRPTLFILKCETLGEEKRIVLHWKDPETGQEHARIAGEPVEHASFSYFGQTGDSAERSWQSEWHNDFGRLEAVKLTLRLRSMPAAIDLVFPLRSDLAVQCTRNPHQRGCRLGRD